MQLGTQSTSDTKAQKPSENQNKNKQKQKQKTKQKQKQKTKQKTAKRKKPEIDGIIVVTSACSKFFILKVGFKIEYRAGRNNWSVFDVRTKIHRKTPDE